MNSLVLIETDMSQFNGETFKEVTAFYSEVLVSKAADHEQKATVPHGPPPILCSFLRHFMSKVDSSLGNSSRR